MAPATGGDVSFWRRQSFITDFRPLFFLSALQAGVAVPTGYSSISQETLCPGRSRLWGGTSTRCFAAVSLGIGRVHSDGDSKLDRPPSVERRAPCRAGIVVAGGPLGLRDCWRSVAAMVVDLACTAVLTAAVWREVLAGRNWKNAPIAVLLTLFSAASASTMPETSTSCRNESETAWRWQ